MRYRFWRLVHDTLEWLWHWSWCHIAPLSPKTPPREYIYAEIYRDDNVIVYRTNSGGML